MKVFFILFTLLLKICNAQNNVATTSAAFLEIGAGGGNSAIFLIKNNFVKNYVIVDLPEMLIYSAYHIDKNCNQINIEFGTDEIVNINNKSNTVFFLTPDQINLVPDNSINFQFSINAFMEMRNDISNRYIKEMYRLGAEESITMIIARINETKIVRD